MLTHYVQAAMRQAKYEIIEDEHPFYGEILICPGVWASAITLEECREELQSALEDWILWRVADHIPLPIIDGIDLNVKETLVEESAA